MKLKINKSQFKLLTSNFVIVEGNRLRYDDNNLITESMKEYKVRIHFNGWQSEIRIGAYSSGTALAVAKIMFPKALVTGSTKQV
jgi:hypothetical protein